MIVVLVLSMYLLMKHRMQVQSRYLSSRRADLLGACNFPNSAGNHHFLPAAPGSARRVELLPVGNDAANHAINSAATLSSRTFPAFARSLAPFLLSGADAGPPPYAPPGQRVRRPRSEALPPLPSYEDATKLPALVPVVVSAEHAEEEPAEGLNPPTNGQRGALNRTAEEGTEIAGREGGGQREATRHGVAGRVPEAAQEPEQQQQQQQRRGER
uniref:Uncharacterized protein n=1 Tax=Globodera pallida TaxID=36090 RepID=A0A183CFI0_GLOPA